MNAFTNHTNHTNRSVTVALLALLILAASVAPALAAGATEPEELTAELSGPELEAELVEPPALTIPDPTSPDDPAPPEGLPSEGLVPSPDPGVIDDLEVTPRRSLTLTPTCDPAGFDFVLTLNTPVNGTKVLQWRSADGGTTHAMTTQGTGSVASGEGTFQARGFTFTQTGLHAITRWVSVTVRCETSRPIVTVDVQPHCDPDGIAYAVEVDNEPAAPVYKAEWRELGGGIHTVEGKTGHLPTGEGTFEVRGVLYDEGEDLWRSEWVEVIVDCTVDPVDRPDPSDDIRPGIPTFTG